MKISLNKKKKSHNSPSQYRIRFIAESSFNAESNLMLSALPALYKRGIAKCFPLYLFSVIHHLNIMKRIAI